MPKLSSYANVTPTTSDQIPLTDASDTNATKNSLISALITLFHAGATFTGDTTFDTDTLFVDSSNDRVGVGTITPTKDVQVKSASAPTVRTENSSNSLQMDIAAGSSAGFLGTASNHDFAMYTNNAEVGRWLAAGGLTFNGDTAAANALDDYEEGTFTPTFVNIGTGTYAIQVGTYTKIGDLVSCQINLDISTLGTASGNLQISGLPFTSSSVSNSTNSTSTVFGNSWTTGRVDVGGLISPSATLVSLRYDSCSASAGTVSHADMGTGSILLNLTYKV
jgi:hypothetical protein